MSATPRCRFYVRTQVTDAPTYRYDSVWLPDTWTRDGCLVTPNPPAVGDLIQLWGDDEAHRGFFEVVARAWLHPAYGSANWPYGQPDPAVGPELIATVVPADGPFRDEAEDDEEEAGD